MLGRHADRAQRRPGRGRRRAATGSTSRQAPEQLVTALATDASPRPSRSSRRRWSARRCSGSSRSGSATRTRARRCPPAARADRARHGPGPADALHRVPGDARRVRPQGLAELPPRPAPVPALDDSIIEPFLAAGRHIGSPMTQGILFRHGGAVSRVPEDATAAGHRDSAYMAHPIACWATPAETEHEMAWVQAVLERRGHRRRPAATYLNFEPGTSIADVKSGFGEEKYQRLVGAQGHLGPGQPVPVQPQHPADRLDAGGRACPLSRGPDLTVPDLRDGAGLVRAVGRAAPGSRPRRAPAP